MNNDRWTTAIHESAHAVCAVVLGGSCSLLTIHNDESGKAFLDDLSPFNTAVAVAAPTAAAELLSDVPPPATEPAPELLNVRPSITELTPRETIDYVVAKYPHGSTPTDAEVIAAYCTRGRETEPDRWVSLFHTVHRVARDVVTDHRDKILRVARELFARGILSETEIQEAMK